MAEDKQLSIRLSEGLHRQVKTLASAKGTTITAVVQELLEGWVESQKAKPEPVDE